MPPASFESLAAAVQWRFALAGRRRFFGSEYAVSEQELMVPPPVAIAHAVDAVEFSLATPEDFAARWHALEELTRPHSYEVEKTNPGIHAINPLTGKIQVLG